ncbi:MAG: hypothetical protein IPK19_25920 [Chloroflexi bacterium]|nr:hypothetical protein [Chloroflexota bacterium]
MRAGLCFDPVDAATRPQVSLTVDGQAIPLDSSEIGVAGWAGERPVGCIGTQFTRSLYDAGENWQITITGLARHRAHSGGIGGGMDSVEGFISVDPQMIEPVRARVETELSAAGIDATVEVADNQIVIRAGVEARDALPGVVERATTDVTTGEWSFNFTLPPR